MAFKFVSFNLRCAWDEDGYNSFLNRAGNIVQKINAEQPELICFQEASVKNIGFLRKALPQYTILLNQRDADLGGEGLAVAFLPEALEVLILDFFWLSPTPNVPGSRYEEQSLCPRICQSVLFKRSSDGKLFWVYNNHLDHEGDQARILGIQQVLDRIKEDQKRFDAPIFILGDFNAYPDSETIRFCEEFKDIPLTDLSAPAGPTFHDFGRRIPNSKIDYIYVDKRLADTEYKASLWTECFCGVYLSDHYPVMLELEF